MINIIHFIHIWKQKKNWLETLSDFPQFSLSITKASKWANVSHQQALTTQLIYSYSKTHIYLLWGWHIYTEKEKKSIHLIFIFLHPLSLWNVLVYVIQNNCSFGYSASLIFCLLKRCSNSKLTDDWTPISPPPPASSTLLVENQRSRSVCSVLFLQANSDEWQRGNVPSSSGVSSGTDVKEERLLTPLSLPFSFHSACTSCICTLTQIDTRLLFFFSRELPNAKQPRGYHISAQS